MIVAGNSMEDFEKQIVRAFGVDYFNGVRWGAATSSAVFFGCSFHGFRTMRRHYAASCVAHGATETAARKQATVLRSMRFAVTSCKLPFLVAVGSLVAGCHNALSASLSNLRVWELQTEQQRQPLEQPRYAVESLKPTFWDGCIVGVLGSALDADTPQQPMFKYLNMKAGY